MFDEIELSIEEYVEENFNPLIKLEPKNYQIELSEYDLEIIKHFNYIVNHIRRNNYNMTEGVYSPDEMFMMRAFFNKMALLSYDIEYKLNNK